MGDGKHDTPRPRVILFDFDRTLIRLYPKKELLARLQIEIVDCYAPLQPPKDVVDLLSDDGYIAWYALDRWAKEQRTPVERAAIDERAARIVTDFEVGQALREGFFDTSARCLSVLASMNIRVGIVSSNSGEAIATALVHFGLDRFVEFTCGRTNPLDTSRLKPSTFGIRIAIDHFSASESTVWYVGDDRVDMLAAVAAGVFPVGVVTGNYSSEELSAAGARLTLKSIAELPDTLASIE